MAGYTCQHILLNIFDFSININVKLWMNKPKNLEERDINFAFKTQAHKDV